MNHFFLWLKEEFIKVFPAVVYFAIAFNLLFYTVGLSLGPNDIRHMTYGTMTLSALIAGKVLVIANSLPFLNAFPHKPLIYNIIWKFIIYNGIVFIFRMLEAFIHPYLHHHSLGLAIFVVRADLHSQSFWASEMWVALVFFVFVIFAEFTRVLGRQRVMKMVFG